VAEDAADVGILRPIFEPGDMLLFDDLFLHKTGSDPEMPKPRYAVESWFFAPSSFRATTFRWGLATPDPAAVLRASRPLRLPTERQ
jgi:hypothetical protein